MATLYIREVPQHLFDELKQLAETERHSMNSAALEIIGTGLQQRRIEMQRRQALTGLDEVRRRIGPTRGDSLELLREDRER